MSWHASTRTTERVYVHLHGASRPKSTFAERWQAEPPNESGSRGHAIYAYRRILRADCRAAEVPAPRSEGPASEFTYPPSRPLFEPTTNPSGASDPFGQAGQNGGLPAAPSLLPAARSLCVRRWFRPTAGRRR